MIETYFGGYKRRVQVVKALIRTFGREVTAVNRLASQVVVADASESQTQHSFRVLLEGKELACLCNQRISAKPDFSQSWPWMQYSMEEARYVGARYLLSHLREALPPGNWVDPNEAMRTAVARD